MQKNALSAWVVEDRIDKEITPRGDGNSSKNVS